MKSNIGLGTIEKRGKSWRIRFSLGLNADKGNYEYLIRSCKGNKRDAEEYRLKLHEMLTYAVPSKPAGTELQTWIKQLEKMAVDKPEGVSWSEFVKQAEELGTRETKSKDA